MSELFSIPFEYRTRLNALISLARPPPTPFFSPLFPTPSTPSPAPTGVGVSIYGGQTVIMYNADDMSQAIQWPGGCTGQRRNEPAVSVPQELERVTTRFRFDRVGHGWDFDSD